MPAYIQQRLPFAGNYCGHDRNHPDFRVRCRPLKQPTPGVGWREGAGAASPRVLRKADELSLAFYWRPSSLPVLNHIVAHTHNQAHETYKKPRQMNSCAREAVVRVSRVLIASCELATLRIGIQEAAVFKPFSVNKIARDAGVSKRRCERTLAYLRNAGYMNQYRRNTKEIVDGKLQYKGEIAVRELTEQFFLDLGVRYQALLKARKLAETRIRQFAWKTGALASSIMTAFLQHRPKQLHLPLRRKDHRREEKILQVAAALREADSSLSEYESLNEAARIFSKS